MGRPEITAVLKLQSTQFVGEMRKMRGQVSKFGSQVQSIGRILGGVFVTGAIVRAINNTAKLGDQLAKMSARTGLTVETLNGLTQAANLSDVSTQQLTIGLFQLNKNLLDTTRGTGEAKISFEAMGIGAKEAAALLKDPEKAFLTIADRLANINDPSRRAAEAMKIFGKSGAQLLPLLNQGSEAIAKQIKEMQRLRPITAEQAKAAEQYNDSLTKLTSASQGLAIAATTELIPALTQLFEALSKLLSSDIDGFTKQMASLLAGDFSKAEQLNAALEKRKFLLQTITQLEATPQSRSFFGVDLSTGRDAKLKLQQQKLTELNAEIALLQVPAPSQSQPAGTGAIASVATTKKNPFALKLPNSSPADPLGVVKAFQELAAATQRGLGEANLENDRRFRELQRNASGSLASRASDSAFRAERFPDNAGAQLVSIRDQVNLRKQDLEQLGKIAEGDRELIRLADQRLAVFKKVSDEQAKIAAKEAAAAEKLRKETAEIARLRGPQIARRDAAIRDLRVDERGRPVQTTVGRLIDREDIARADLVAAQQQFAATGSGEALDKILLLEERLRSLGIVLDNVDTDAAIAGFRQLSGIVGNTMNTMVQGVLLGTQTLGEAWDNFMRNTLLNIVSKGFQALLDNMLDALFEAAAQSAAGKAIGAGLGALFAGSAANGGVLTMNGFAPLQRFATGGIATRPTLAVFGEGATNEAFVPLPDGRSIPVTLRGRGSQATSQPAPAQVTVVLNNPIDPSVFGLSEKDVVNIVVNNVKQDGVIRRTIGASR